MNVENQNILRDSQDVLQKWKDDFSQLFNNFIPINERDDNFTRNIQQNNEEKEMKY